MNAFNSQFSTVTVYSDPEKHKSLEPGKPLSESEEKVWDTWMTNVTSAAKRRRNRLKARAELEALGIDPDRFLEYHRVQI